MEEKNEKKKVENTQETTKNFKTGQNPSTYKTVYQNSKKEKVKVGFGKSVLLPFFSGIVGCAVVVGTCFGVPSIRSHILGTNSNISGSNSSSSENSGYVSQTSLSNYSDTSVYAANKILPSIVGIKVEYNVNSLISMFGRQSQTTTAEALSLIHT